MARINNGTQRDWQNGNIVTSDDYEQDREILTVAINDNQDQLDSLKASTGAGLIGVNAITDLNGTTVQTVLQSIRDNLKSSGSTFVSSDAITGLNGNTVFAQLTALKALIDAMYTKAQLDNGELDNRYYTKDLLDGGQLDTKYFNRAQLQSTTSGGSGSELIGSGPITGVTGTTVYAQLQSLKNAISQAAVGTIPDGSIGTVKLSFTPLQASDKGVVNGVASLDNTGKVSTSQLNQASTTQTGITQLYDGVDSTNKGLAATANAVKSTYDLASGKYSKPSSGIPTTDLDASVQNSLSLANSSVQSIPIGSTTEAGIVQLTNAVNSTSVSTAATASAVKSAYDLANGIRTDSTKTFVVEVRTTDPASPVNGQVWLRSDL